MFRWIRNSFLAGLIFLLPIVATIYIIFVIFAALDRVVRPLSIWIFGVEIYGLGIVMTMLLILIAGIVARNIFGKKLVSLSEWIMTKIPLVNQIYGTVKQIIDAIFNKASTAAFKKVVMIEYPRKGIYQLGFITNEGIQEIESQINQKMVNIFLPTTPNPTSGMFIMIPKDDVFLLEMTVEEGIKIILSGGVLVPQWRKGDLRQDSNSI